MWFTGDKSDLADIFPIPFPYNDMFSLWLLNIIAFSILEHALHVFNIPHFGCQDVLDRWVHVKSSIGIPICLRVCIADISRIIFIVVLDMRCSIWKKSLKGRKNRIETRKEHIRWVGCYSKNQQCWKCILKNNCNFNTICW